MFLNMFLTIFNPHNYHIYSPLQVLLTKWRKVGDSVYFLYLYTRRAALWALGTPRGYH